MKPQWATVIEQEPGVAATCWYFHLAKDDSWHEPTDTHMSLCDQRFRAISTHGNELAKLEREFRGRLCPECLRVYRAAKLAEKMA